MLNDRLANDVRRNGTHHSSGTNDDRVLRALVRNEIYAGSEMCSCFKMDSFNLCSRFTMKFVQLKKPSLCRRKCDFTAPNAALALLRSVEIVQF